MVPMHILLRSYNPAEPRDERGRWTTEGDAGASPSRQSPGSSPTIVLAAGSPENAKKPNKATGDSHRIVLAYGDGTEEERTGGSRTWRANNPCAVTFGPFAIAHGAIGSDSLLAVFPDEETGWAAAGALMRSDSYANLSVDEAIRKWCQPDDPSNYQRFVRQVTGLSGDRAMSSLDAMQIASLLAAMRDFEKWRVGNLVRSNRA